MNPRWIGYFEVILSGVAFGFLGLFGKKLFELQLLPTELLAFRFIISSFLLGCGLLIFCRHLLIVKITELIKLIMLGALGYAVFASCFFKALQGLSASLTVLLLYIYPVLVALGSHFVFKEKLKSNGWVALFISCIGLYLLVGAEWSVSGAEYLMYGVLAAVFYSLYILASRQWLKNISAYTSTFYIQLSAAIVLFFISFQSFHHTQSLFINSWEWLLLVAIVSTLLAMFLFLKGLQKITSGEASILSTTEPLTGLIVAFLFLGERPSSFQLVGGVLLIVSMVLLSRSSGSEKNSPRN